MRFQSSQFTRILKILNIVEYLDHLAMSKLEDSVAMYLLLVQVIGSESIIFQIHYWLLFLFESAVGCFFRHLVLMINGWGMDLWESLVENWEREEEEWYVCKAQLLLIRNRGRF